MQQTGAEVIFECSVLEQVVFSVSESDKKSLKIPKG
jgi:hypothetical protein